MENEVKIYSKCRSCNGTGIDTQIVADQYGNPIEVEQDCENCSATGNVQAVDGLVGTEAVISGSFFDDVIDKLNDIKEKVDNIKEVVDEL